MKRMIAALAAAAGLAAAAQTIVSTDKYEWRGDSIVQGEFCAYAPNAHEIVSNYSAQPHYFMPIDKTWRLHNDISAYPRLHSGNTLLDAAYNLALDEMVNAVEPDTTLRTGKEWAGVWTRDVSYSIILSMAYMQPEASRISLMKKVTPDGRIVQDTGSGGAWPISTDRQVWTLAAWELYLVTGDIDWLRWAYPIAARSMEDDLLVAYTNSGDNVQQPFDMPAPGLARGETSFIDWREQSYPRWMQTADIYESQAMSTNMVHAAAMQKLADMARLLGYDDEAARWDDLADSLRFNINDAFWMDDRGYYAMYLYGRDYMVGNDRAETLGESLSILYDIAPDECQSTITERVPVTPYGAPIFYPQISDMPAYHNNALWPWVASMWALANAKVGNEDGTMQAIGSIIRPAALFCTNKENLNLDNGDIATELNSSNMLWCLAGNLALNYRILFGIHFEEDGLAFRPFVPQALAGERKLENFKYRNASLNITVKGHGDSIASFRLNGKEHKPLLPTGLKGKNKVEITLCSSGKPAMAVNNVPNLKAPLTPIARLTNSPELDGPSRPVNNLLSWNPIEYIDHYIVLRNGRPVCETTATEWPAIVAGSYQVIGVAADGTQSFASEPCSNQPYMIVEMPGEGTAMVSPEVSYQPRTDSIYGWHGQGFVEVDHATAPIEIEVNVPQGGLYALTLVYANGNGPVNTENKCAIRTIAVDGSPAGTVVMPHRGVGNWCDWGKTNAVEAILSAGVHKVVIAFLPENENMNIATNHAIIDRLILTRLTYRTF